MSGLIGRKLGMTSIFDARGNNVGCTVIEAGPCYVTQIKNIDKDGYKSIQLAFDESCQQEQTELCQALVP